MQQQQGERKGRVAGKVALITGAGNGIGRATALLFAKEGCKVGVADISNDGQQVAAEINKEHGEGTAIFRKTDVSKEAEVEACVGAVVETFGRLDILVNNAAAFVFGQVDTASEQDWDKVISVNIKGMAFCAKHAVKQMKSQEGGKGSIVNLASVSSFLAQSNFVPYSTTKAAILGLTRNLAMDLAPNIRVNAVAPGTIDTTATRNASAAKGYSLTQLAEIEAPKHMLKRMGQPEEVAFPILFLASDEASFITATTLMVDGGYSAM